jgi:hypothetical protein
MHASREHCRENLSVERGDNALGKRVGVDEEGSAALGMLDVGGRVRNGDGGHKGRKAGGSKAQLGSQGAQQLGATGINSMDLALWGSERRGEEKVSGQTRARSANWLTGVIENPAKVTATGETGTISVVSVGVAGEDVKVCK